MNNLPENPNAGFVYLIQAVGTNRYKVGKTRDITKRVETLRSQSCYPLRLLDYVKYRDCGKHERRIHRALSEWRVHGEWFELPEEMLRFLHVFMRTPNCTKIQRVASDHAIVSFRGSTQKIDLQEAAKQEIERVARKDIRKGRKFHLPKTDEALVEVICTLGHVAKIGKVTNKAREQLELMIGAVPASGEEAFLWKQELKAIRKRSKKGDCHE